MERRIRGIHYRTGIDAGAAQGRAVGEFVIRKFMLDPTKQKSDVVPMD